MDKSVENFNLRLRTVKIHDLIIGMLLAVILTGISMVIFPEIEANDDLFIIVLLIFMSLFFVWCLRGTTGLANNFRNLFVESTRNEILYVFAINLIFAFLFLFFITVIDMFIGMNDPSWVSVLDIDSVDVAPGAFLFTAITSIIFAPVLEELIFRGVLFNRLKIRVGIIPAMIFSSLLFGIGHDFGGITSAFLFGMCMCILYLKTDNILVPMSVHFTNNVVATILEITSFDLYIIQFPWIILLGIITLIGTVLLVKYIIQESSNLKKEYI